MPTVIVTGGSGKLGKSVIKELLNYNWNVINVDINPSKEKLCKFIKIDLENTEQTFEILSNLNTQYNSIDAIVHIAGVVSPLVPPTDRNENDIFKINTISTYNIFNSAQKLNINNIVWASSETLLGNPFDIDPPYIPVDEEYYPRPESSYSLSKLLGETMSKEFCKWNPEMKIIGLRFSNVMDVSDYEKFIKFTTEERKWNLWGYIDSRDAAQAVRKSLDFDYKGVDNFIIASPDTVTTIPNDDLIKEYFPNVAYKKTDGQYDTLLSIKKAINILGYNPEHSWRNYI